MHYLLYDTQYNENICLSLYTKTNSLVLRENVFFLIRGDV